MRRFLALVSATLIGLSMFAGSSAGLAVGGGAGSKGQDGAPSHQGGQPKLVRKWQGDKATAADLVARGKATVDSAGRVKLPNGKFVDYRTEGTDHIVTLLVEFAAGAGPLHNQIPAPDRAVDNSTFWMPDFNPDHYRGMMFMVGGNPTGLPSMADYYLEVSSGRYMVNGQVSNWIPIPYEEADFGADATYGGDDKNGAVFRIVDAALQGTATVNEGIDWSPSVVDVWDRYDCDGDGNFNEPDGYVDHFTIIHAGIGQEDDGGAQGSDAIWSHRWYANFGDIGSAGPGSCLFGGYEVPDTGLWVGDYTIEPENGGVGVLAHEFAHDLGLPDLYDTEGWNDNSVSFWDLMSDGSNVSSPDVPHIGTQPTHMGAWDKLVLGWLDRDLATLTLGDDRKVTLGPAEGRTAGTSQALRVNLPNYQATSTVFAPEGTDPYYYYSTQGNDIDTTMRRALAAPLTADGTITFRANYDIELDWDYAYVQYSTDNGLNWQNAEGNLSTTTDPNGQNFGFGITSTSGGWVSGTYALPAGTTNIGFRYWTDGAVVGQGFAVDSIAVNGGAIDDGSNPAPWTFGGFLQTTNGQFTKTYFHYYLAESRSYVRSDIALCGAYLFITNTMVDKECYADGILVWYRNSMYADNNVSAHPGYGQVLVVDSHPAAMPLVVGKGWIRERWQTWDSTFTLRDHSIALTSYRGAKLYSRTYLAPAVPVFNDSGVNAYYDPRVPYSSVKLPGSGLKIALLSVSADGTTYQVRVYR